MDRTPPTSLVKEMFCSKLEREDYVAALTCMTNNLPKDSQPFSKSSWLKLLKNNSHRFQKDTIVGLMNEANKMVSNSSLPNPTLEYLIQSCKKILFSTDMSEVDMDSMKNAVEVEVENKLVIANSR